MTFLEMHREIQSISQEMEQRLYRARELPSFEELHRWSHQWMLALDGLAFEIERHAPPGEYRGRPTESEERCAMLALPAAGSQ